jgi:hypothetical protein
MALFKSMDRMANMAGTMFPGTIVPIQLELRSFDPVLSGRGKVILRVEPIRRNGTDLERQQ